MENELKAPRDGVVKEIRVVRGRRRRSRRRARAVSSWSDPGTAAASRRDRRGLAGRNAGPAAITAASSATSAGPRLVAGRRGSSIMGRPGSWRRRSRFCSASWRRWCSRRAPASVPARAAPVAPAVRGAGLQQAHQRRVRETAPRARRSPPAAPAPASGSATPPAPGSAVSRAGSSSGRVTITKAKRVGSDSSARIAPASRGQRALGHGFEDGLGDGQHAGGVPRGGPVDDDQVVARPPAHQSRSCATRPCPAWRRHPGPGRRPGSRAPPCSRTARGTATRTSAPSGAYSCRALLGVMFTAHSPSSTGTTSSGSGRVSPNSRARRSADSICASSTRLPADWAARASAAATVVRPTPPLPATIRKRRSSTGVPANARRRPRGRTAQKACRPQTLTPRRSPKIRRGPAVVFSEGARNTCA